MPRKNLDKLLGSYQGNAYPGIVRHLATNLGVSEDSLYRLGLGWAPIVTFKKGPNFQGWYVIPERDDNAKVVGLSLRSVSNTKVMYPGTKHGLVYEVNPEHSEGSESYTHGAHNWIRTMDAGVNCPVCGKPDGCLVHHENPEDPQAAVCIRVKSPKQLKFGYLHVLKDAGRLNTGASALANNGGPVVIVEGMTDAAAAMDLGFDAVGRPSNLAGLDALKELIRGRDVIIVGENDNINPQTGQRPGHEGMTAAFQVLRNVVKSAKMMLPPEHAKDLRSWVRKYGITRDGFLEHLEKKGKDRTEQTVLMDDQPYTLAKSFLDKEYRMGRRYLLKKLDGRWYRYNGVKYVEEPEDKIRGPMYDWAQDKLVTRKSENGERVEPLSFQRNTVTNMLDAMLAPRLCQVASLSYPCWINGAKGPDPRDLIVFENGILHVPAYLAGQPESKYLLPHTPDFFTLFSLPFPFDPTADCPTFREAILERSLEGDGQKIDLFLEWLGYNMTSDTKMQKIMLMRGIKGSGKSTSASVIETLVGEDQRASTSFRQLATNFGLESLVGAQAVLMGDARLPSRNEGMQALEVLLKLSGEDTFNVDRKHIQALRGHRFRCKITMTVNEIPQLPDHASAMERRLLILDFPHTVPEEHLDPDLKDKLTAEAPGIALLALDGLRRVRENGKFTTPDGMAQALAEWRSTTSPIAAMLEECTDIDDDGEIDQTELFDVWNGWADERGMKVISRSLFRERIKANAQYATSETYEKGGHVFRVYRGITLKPWAAKAYLGKVE